MKPTFNFSLHVLATALVGTWLASSAAHAGLRSTKCFAVAPALNGTNTACISVERAPGYLGVDRYSVALGTRNDEGKLDIKAMLMGDSDPQLQMGNYPGPVKLFKPLSFGQVSRAAGKGNADYTLKIGSDAIELTAREGQKFELTTITSQP